MFQADGQEDGFHGPGIGHVDSGAGVHFGPVEKAVECLLVFFAQGPPKWFQPFPFSFNNVWNGLISFSFFLIIELLDSNRGACRRNTGSNCFYHPRPGFHRSEQFTKGEGQPSNSKKLKNREVWISLHSLWYAAPKTPPSTSSRKMKLVSQ